MVGVQVGHHDDVDLRRVDAGLVVRLVGGTPTAAHGSNGGNDTSPGIDHDETARPADRERRARATARTRSP